ncbi:MAG: sulfur carrier protein ThiS [Solirubrobacterales bacterium]
MSSIELTVNGGATSVPAGCTIAQLIERLELPPQGRGVAIAVDEAVVPRGEWAKLALEHGQRVEIVTATQGG